jgi:hypothetical protein
MALVWLSVGYQLALGGFGWLAFRLLPFPECAVGTTKDPKNKKWQRFGGIEAPAGWMNSVLFASRSFFVCLEYFVV